MSLWSRLRAIPAEDIVIRVIVPMVLADFLLMAFGGRS